jgi:pyrroline-5-carboxylate reductase
MDNLRPALVGAVAGVSAYFLCSALFDKNVSGDIDGSCAAGEVPDVLGFVGIGTINSAVIRGLCTAPNPPKRIIISPRSGSKAAALKAEYPAIIEIAGTNQEVVDSAIWIVVATPPQPAVSEAVLRPLKFRAEQVRSFVSKFPGWSIHILMYAHRLSLA